jgi:AraC-like DNA-binding protein
VTDRATANESHLVWAKATFDDFAAFCCEQPQLRLLSDPDSFSLTQRAGRIGPIGLSELVVGSELSIERGELCDTYRVLVTQSGQTDCVHRSLTFSGGPDTAAVLTPQGHASSRLRAGNRTLAVKINRHVVDGALSDALGRQVTSQIDFSPVMPVKTGHARTWVNLLGFFKQQLFRPDGLLSRPLVGMPFVDCLVRGLLLAADHPHRAAIAADHREAAPRAIRVAVDIMEAEAHLPLTLAAVAARIPVSVRTLQYGFRQHLQTTPMAYLRDVRLRLAHQDLLDAEPSTDTVTSICYRWGFTNGGRFTAVHTARYGESPSVTLRRTSN